MTRIVTIHDIAKQVYYSNKAWCEANGDFSFTASWEDAPAWQRETNIKGVVFLIQNPDAAPSASHESWMAEKTAQGWVYGEKKDAIARTHPAYLPYDQLPDHQKVKDYLFRGIVMAMLPFVSPTILKEYLPEVPEKEWVPADKDPTGEIITTRAGITQELIKTRTAE